MMNQKTIAIAAVLAAAMLTGMFATPMAYADDSETSTEQELKQSNVGSGESTNENCGSNSIDSFIDATVCGEVEIGPLTEAVQGMLPQAQEE
jgi:uncharacterized low-complexity protein